MYSLPDKMHLGFEAFIRFQIMVHVGHSCYRNIEQLGLPEMWSTAALMLVGAHPSFPTDLPSIPRNMLSLKLISKCKQICKVLDVLSWKNPQVPFCKTDENG